MVSLFIFLDQGHVTVGQLACMPAFASRKHRADTFENCVCWVGKNGLPFSITTRLGLLHAYST